MQEEQAKPFSLLGSFEAAPHLYNYLHRLSFSSSGIVEMFDGAGQHLNARVKGRFCVQIRDHNAALVQFSDLVELKLKPPFSVHFKDPSALTYEGTIFVENPDYQNEEPLRTLAPISILVTREEGIYPLVQQIIWKIDDEQQWPYLLYRVRYMFEIDPLGQVRDRRVGQFCYQQEGWEEPDARYYYCQDDAQKLTYDALIQMGISLS
ncbi:MAG TPA: hypothetical protein VKR06_18865 [Ktedonosporobacter sp.]|nr:hypothetical protein [Ktedonosporobacter sp.]